MVVMTKAWVNNLGDDGQRRTGGRLETALRGVRNGLHKVAPGNDGFPELEIYYL